MKPRQRQPAVGLGGIGVLDKKEFRLGGLGLRQAAQLALGGRHGFGLGQVAGAAAHVGAPERQQQENDYSDW
jgi:hypothetical protein